MDAFSERISWSETLPGSETSLQDPTEIWFLLRPSPRIALTEKYKT